MEVLVLYVGPPGLRILAEAQMELLTGGSLAAGEPFTSCLTSLCLPPHICKIETIRTDPTRQAVVSTFSMTKTKLSQGMGTQLL